MPFITAPRIHNGQQWLPEGTVIETAEDGHIVALYEGGLREEISEYDGVLAPGFVNAHCHVELSHMKGVVPERTGLIPFLQTIPTHRNDFTDEQKTTARRAACEEMVRNGIVGVGDIANVADTLDVRERSGLHFHTFIEAIGFSEVNAQRSFDRSEQVYHAFAAQQPKNDTMLRQSIVPHAPYSVSKPLFGLIDQYQKDSIISIHNQESRAEDEYYLLKKGPVNQLLHGLGIDDSFFVPSGKTSLQTYLEWLSPSHPFLFVHNTFTSLNDLQLAQSYLRNVYWCLCPNANLYIENELPDVDMLVREQVQVCVGTDSLASNHQLSVLSELQLLKKHFAQLDWELLLQWGTYNGACALQMNHAIGSITAGNKPGVVHIADIDKADVAVVC